MKLVLTFPEGAEKIIIKKFKQLSPEIVYPGKAIVNATKKDVNKIKKLGIIDRILILKKKGKFKNLKDIANAIKKPKFKFKGSFCVRCYRKGIHDFTSKEVESVIGNIINKKGYKVNLTNPNVKFYVEILENLFLFGQVVDENLCKRNYRVQIISKSIPACIARALILYANLKKNSLLMNHYARDSIIAIEAWLYGIKKVYAVDPNKYSIKKSRINAKLANAKITFYCHETDWLETLFKENSVDCIAAAIPFPTKRVSKKAVLPEIREFLGQAEKILKPKGKFAVIAPKISHLEEVIKNYKFLLEEKGNLKQFQFRIYKKID